jgi:ribose 5-phosphate isomerase A
LFGLLHNFVHIPKTMETAKRAAAEYAVKYVQDGMIVALGSGSTVHFMIRKLGERVRNEGLKIQTVASSDRSEQLAREFNIPVLDVSAVSRMDIGIDGADEVDRHGNLIKGGGGALLREKILAFNSNAFHVIVDQDKPVDVLGKFPLPVEVIPFGINLATLHLKALGCTPILRVRNDKTFITENGNRIIDCQFNAITDPDALSTAIKKIPGVVESGLFSGKLVKSVIVGRENGEVSEVLF